MPEFIIKSELLKLSKEKLVQMVLNLQCQCGQLKNQQTNATTKYNEMMNKFVRTNKRSKRKIKERNYRYIALKVAYLGWNLDGLQSNPNLDDSVENILRGALRETRLVDPSDPVKFTKCGRTDKGVSAFNQVMTLCVNSKLDCGVGIKPVKEMLDELNSLTTRTEKADSDDDEVIPSKLLTTDQSEASKKPQKVDTDELDYPLILNRVLPKEIRVLAWSPLDTVNFSARHDCHGREYCYYFPKGNLDINLMKTAAKQFCGLHDFRNFSKLNVSSCKTYVRRIDTFEIFPCSASDTSEPYHLFYAKITGSGFVYHQVRSMMAILFLIGWKKETEDVISKLLNIQSVMSKPCYGLATGHSLVLHDSLFEAEPLKWQTSSDTFAKLLIHCQSFWSDIALKAQVVQELIRFLKSDNMIEITHSSSDFILKTTANTCEKLSQELDVMRIQHGVNKNLIQDNFCVDRYKPVLHRPRGKTLEDQLAHFESKKARIKED